MRIRDYSSNTKPIAANGIAVFTNTEIPSSKLVALHFTMTGAGNSLAAISRIRIKASGQTIYDTTPAFLRAWLQSLIKQTYPASNSADANGGGTMQELRRFSIPFCDLTQVTKDAQDTCQFPRGANITVEIQFNGSAAAGTVAIAWTQTDQEPTCYQKLISQQMQIVAGSTNSRYQMSDEGFIRGIGINTIGLNRLRLVLSGAQVLHLGGQMTASATLLVDSGVVEADQLWNRLTDIANATAGVPTTFYNPYFLEIDAMLPAAAGNSYAELATDGTNWGGATNELLIASQVPQ